MNYNEKRQLVEAIIAYGSRKWECGNVYERLLNDAKLYNELVECENIASEQLSAILDMLFK